MLVDFTFVLAAFHYYCYLNPPYLIKKSSDEEGGKQYGWASPNE